MRNRIKATIITAALSAMTFMALGAPSLRRR